MRGFSPVCMMVFVVGFQHALLSGCTKPAPHRSAEEVRRLDAVVDWSRSSSRSIEIEAPVSEVWSYLSDSARATEWSSYFDHIRALSGPFPDGSPGSVRRCFRNRNERGPRWDEMTAAVEPGKRRLIRSFHFFGYWPELWTRSGETLVEQKYESLTSGRTRLTFSTIPVPDSPWISRLLISMSEPETLRFFELNQRNIKAALESKQAGKPYVRPYAWEAPPSSWGERWFTDQIAVEKLD